MLQTDGSKYSYIFVKNKEIFSSVKKLVHDKTIIIPHICNNVNAFGSGFSGSIDHHFPIVKDNFYLLGNKNKLGHTQFIEVAKSNKHKIIVANMIAQNGLKNKSNPRPLNYWALAHCMYNVNLYIKDIMNTIDDEDIEIHTIKFGAGLAGGNWKFISDIIDDIWSKYLVFIYGSNISTI